MNFWSKKSLIILVLVVVLTFLTLFILKSTKTFNDVEGFKIFDCSSNYKKCDFKFIKNTVENCNEWYPGKNSIKDLHCNLTIQSIDQVSIVGDAANHITSPITKINYEVNILTSLSKIFYDIILPHPLVAIGEISNQARSWDLEFLPDGSFLVTLKSGRLIHYKDDEFNIMQKIPVLHGEFTGLMGLAINPNYKKNNYIYLYYSTSFDNSFKKKDYFVMNRISRFIYKEGKLSKEKILLDNIPGNKFHVGGRLEIGPDKKLYATTGDGIKEKSQDIHYLGGKILRMNLDGTIPSNNPFKNSYVYSRGHRNPQGLAWNPKTGNLYATEHGPWRYDEINLIKRGRNYGWPDMKCDEITNPDVTKIKNLIQPVMCFKNWTLAPSGAVFVDDKNHPWYGNLFVAGLRGRHLHRFVIDDNKLIQDEIFYLSKKTEKGILHPRIRDVEFYNGSIWILSDVFGVAKLTPN